MIISVKVKPGSKQGPKIEQTSNNEYVVYIRERAHDGEANIALINLLSKYFNLPKTSIKIKSGLSARTKKIELN